MSWIAGYLDAKGSITRKALGVRRRPCLIVRVVDSNREGLTLLMEAFGGRITSWNSGRAWRWSVEGSQAVRCLERVAPDLILKRQRAELALALRDTPELLPALTRGAL